MVTAERDTPGAERSDGHRDSTPGSAQFQQAGGAQGHALAADGNPHHAELNGAPAPTDGAARARWTRRRSRAATPPATTVIKLPARESSDRAQSWLRNAMIALGILAAAAAVVSWDAQYVLVRAVKHSTPVAALEAGIPDVGALIFAALGIALALHGRRAIRARTLNVACVGISLAMNTLASAPGWRDLAIWVMPPTVYAVASDTLIGVIRAWSIARTQHRGGQVLADDDATPMAIIGGLVLWLLRLALARISTIGGFRRWVVEECPIAPGRKAPPPRPNVKKSAGGGPSGRAPRTRKPGKQARMIALAAERHDLTTIPLKQVSGIANTIGAEVSLSPGTARRVLLAHVRNLQNGHHPEETP
jgi:hypothetical protein